ncbi:beta-1 adrenergic receptor [Plakobranchus ocellatus]|uniref:Beta-1 adrenergic receptor n=1 Tax=Plakobranchus ocellatus TaxID=259542 RepID=A0AAV4DR33_9GAST|nr:beta-1 adrenergic receptor [Plakobranchus ocellatus]
MTSPVTQSSHIVYPCMTMNTSYGTFNEITVQTESYSEQYGCSDEHFSSDPFNYFHILAGAAIMFENLILIIIICRSKSLHTITNILVASMAVTDFAVGTQCVQIGLLSQSSGMRSWLGLKGDKMHLFLSFLFSGNVSCVLVSFLHMCLLAVDRYLYVLLPFRYERLVTRRRVLSTACTVWTLGLIYVAAVTSLLQKKEYRKTCLLYEMLLVFYYWPLVIANILCLLVVLTCTLGIAQLALKHRRKKMIRNVDIASTPDNTKHSKTKERRGSFFNVNHNNRATVSEDTVDNVDTICCNGSGTMHNQGVSFDLTRFNTNDITMKVSDVNTSCFEKTENGVSKTVAKETSSRNIPKKTKMITTSLTDGENTDPPPEKTPECISTTNNRDKLFFDTAGKSAGGGNSTKHFSQHNVHCNDYRKESRLLSKANLKVIKFVLVLFGALFVCSAPSIVIITMFKLFKIAAVPDILIGIMRIVLILNSCLNFFIISYMSKDFRQALTRHLPCCVVCCSQREKPKIMSIKTVPRF